MNNHAIMSFTEKYMSTFLLSYFPHSPKQTNKTQKNIEKININIWQVQFFFVTL